MGDDVFLVYKQNDGRYTLWGITSINGLDTKVWQTGGPDELGFAFVYFTPFKALDEDKRIPNLTVKDLVGKIWGQGRYRYIDKKQADRIRLLVK
jgi:hypothetical protein